MNKKFVYEDGIGFVSLEDTFKQNPLLKIVNSARISYARQKEELDNKDLKLIEFLYKHNHHSPFRHSYYTFHLKLPLFVFRQFIKHQVGSSWQSFEVDGQETSKEIYCEINDLMFDECNGCSWNEVSGRYVKLEPQFYIPSRFRSNAGHANKQASSSLLEDFNHDKWQLVFKEHSDYSYKLYLEALEQGIAREQARSLLPQSIYTESYWTTSLQSLMHFLNLRSKPDAQEEIRLVANAIIELVENDLHQVLQLQK